MSRETATAPHTAKIPAWSEDPLTARTRAVWTSGDFLPIARSFATGAEDFISRLSLRAGESVLDVACGTGNLAIPAARAGASVSGIDIAANLIAAAHGEARAAGVRVAFEVGDAESLPYTDGRFDTTVTMFGAMFTARPERVAAELRRVTRPGGRIVVANWTPAGFIGSLLRAHVAVVPPPAGGSSPLEWGKPEIVQERFGVHGLRVTCTPRVLEFRFPVGPEGVAELFATHYGPTIMTLRATDAPGSRQLREAITRLFAEHNLATDGTTRVTAEYLEVLVEVA